MDFLLWAGAPSDTWTVATNSLPDEMKFFFATSLGYLYDKAPFSPQEVDMHIALFNFLHFPLHSSPVQVFFFFFFST